VNRKGILPEMAGTDRGRVVALIRVKDF